MPRTRAAVYVPFVLFAYFPLPMRSLLRLPVWAALGLVLFLPDAAVAQHRPDRGDDGHRPGWNRGDDDRDERPRPQRKRRPAPDDGGVSIGLYGGAVDDLPTGGVRLGVGLVRLYAEASGNHHRDGYTAHKDRPEQTAFGIDLTLPARHPGLRALYGIAGVGVQSRVQDVYYAYDAGVLPCDIRVADCYDPYYGSSSERDSRFYGTLGLGMRLPLGGGRVALTGEVAGRFVADRYDGGYVAPTANVGVSVRLR